MNLQTDAANWRRLCAALNEGIALVVFEDGSPMGKPVGCLLELESILRTLEENDYESITPLPPEIPDERFDPLPYGPRDMRGDGPMHYTGGL